MRQAINIVEATKARSRSRLLRDIAKLEWAGFGEASLSNERIKYHPGNPASVSLTFDSPVAADQAINQLRNIGYTATPDDNDPATFHVFVRVLHDKELTDEERVERETQKIAWAVPKRCQRLVQDGDEIVIWIDVAKFDKAFARDSGFYIASGGEGGIKNRYKDFEKWLEQGIPVEMPEAYVNERRNDIVGFTNGRHRYAWMRDHGAQSLPVVVPREHAEMMHKLYGSNQKETVIRNA